MTSQDLDAFAAWVEDLMRDRGYDIDSPRGGGKSRIADEAGVHRAAVTRLLQRQSMPDLETTRRLARVLGVPVRDMLIRSGRLTAEELADPHDYLASPRPAPSSAAAPRWRRSPTCWGCRPTGGRCSCGWSSSSCRTRRRERSTRITRITRAPECW